MDIIDYMPFLLERCRQEPPYSVQVGYAMWAVRAILGAPVIRVPSEASFDSDGYWRILAWRSNGHRYPSVESAALANIIADEAAAEPIEIKEYRAEITEDQPRIRAKFLQNVDAVRELLNGDGTYMVHTKENGLESTSNSYKIAAELGVLSSVVRQAQRQLKQYRKGA